MKHFCEVPSSLFRFLFFLFDFFYMDATMFPNSGVLTFFLSKTLQNVFFFFFMNCLNFVKYYTPYKVNRSTRTIPFSHSFSQFAVATTVLGRRDAIYGFLLCPNPPVAPLVTTCQRHDFRCCRHDGEFSSDKPQKYLRTGLKHLRSMCTSYICFEHLCKQLVRRTDE